MQIIKDTDFTDYVDLKLNDGEMPQISLITQTGFITRIYLRIIKDTDFTDLLDLKLIDGEMPQISLITQIRISKKHQWLE